MTASSTDPESRMTEAPSSKSVAAHVPQGSGAPVSNGCRADPPVWVTSLGGRFY